MAASKPTVVFVPGFWHTTEGFGPLSALLRKADYPTIPFDLPSAGAHPGHPDFSQDVASLRALVTGLADAGKDVVVVMHSGGSIIGSEALRGLSKKERGGKDGGVVRLVYIAILLPDAGMTMMEKFMSVIASPDLDPDFVLDTNQDSHVIAEDGTSIITDGETRFYNDLPPIDAKYWASRMTSLSLGVAGSTFTYEAWKHIPSAYVMCLEDKSIPLKQVREIVKNAGIELVLELKAGHCGYLSQPDAVAAFIRKAAGEVV